MASRFVLAGSTKIFTVSVGSNGTLKSVYEPILVDVSKEGPFKLPDEEECVLVPFDDHYLRNEKEIVSFAKKHRLIIDRLHICCRRPTTRDKFLGMDDTEIDRDEILAHLTEEYGKIINPEIVPPFMIGHSDLFISVIW